jgi:hypothetical protein
MLRNYVTELHYEIKLQNYVKKLLRETKNNRNYVILCEFGTRRYKWGFILWKIPFDGCFGSFIQLKLRVITLHFVSENGYYA